MTSGFVSSVGLLLDIAGSFFLAESFVLKKREQALRETRAYYDGNLSQLRSAIHQAIEARVGFVCLFVGFSAQFVGYTDWLEDGRNDTAVLVVAIGLGAFVVLAAAVRRVSRWASRRAIVREWGESIETNLGPDRPTLGAEKLARICKIYGDALDLRRRKDEGVERLRIGWSRWFSVGGLELALDREPRSSHNHLEARSN